MNEPKAFISYSHDSTGHKAWVLRLASDLRANGIDVVLDQWDLVPGQDVSLFMQRGIAEADRVILICSPPYVSKSETGVGGVGYASGRIRFIGEEANVSTKNIAEVS